jgi:hypothetical protein
MASKRNFVEKILLELRLAQTIEWKPPPSGPTRQIRFPPLLPLGNGEQLRVTEALLKAISGFSKLWMENQPTLRTRLKFAEFNKLARQVFGKVLHALDLDDTNDVLVDLILEDVDRLFVDWMHQHNRAIDLTLGSQLLRGKEAYPIRVGPVLFEPRLVWAQRSAELGRLSQVTVRRLELSWRGKPARKRMPSLDALTEQSALDTIGDCPIVCTVETNGLSGQYVQEKGLLAARLAILAVALLWDRPSKALKSMHLHYDARVFRRETLMFSESRLVSSRSELSRLPVGQWTDEEVIEEISSFQWLFDQVGEALCSYVQPTQQILRPKVMNSLFLSLWWFHEACREPLDQIATTKFAASMDALVVGQNPIEIVRFIEARLGYQAESPIMKDGPTTREVITKIYTSGRSRLIHGNSSDFAYDWSHLRSTAEVIGRQCLVAACKWLEQNQTIDDLKELSKI